MTREAKQSSDLSLLNEVKTGPAFDFSVVAGVFFVGISVGALIPVGMKFFGYWKAPVSASVVEKSSASTESRTKAKAKEISSASAESAAIKEEPSAPREALAAPTPEKTLKLPVETIVSQRSKAQEASISKPKPVQNRGKIQAIVSEPIAPVAKRERKLEAEAEIAELERKAALKQKTEQRPGEIIEEVAEGPSAAEIQALTATYLQQKTVGSQQPAPQMVAMVKTSDTAPLAPLPTASTPLQALTSSPEKKVGAALSINNASYSKNNLEACKKRCLLLGLDAFGMPVKAIISGSAYAQALLQHKGTINLAGQPRLIKNQQVLIVDSITFNLSPSLGGGGSELPQGIKANYTPAPAAAQAQPLKR